MIKDDFWLDFAENSIAKSIESREKAAEKLDTYVTFLWTLYTGIFTTAVITDLLDASTVQLIWAALPIPVLLISKFLCTLVPMPSTLHNSKLYADPNNVSSIIDAFKNIVKIKRNKLLRAQISTFVGIMCIPGALIGYNAHSEVAKAAIKDQKNRIKIHEQKMDFNLALGEKRLKELNDNNLKKLDSLCHISEMVTNLKPK